MINWNETATKFGYKDSAEMWEDLYVKKELSISQLERKFGVSRNPIRDAIQSAGISFRGRGGANYQRVVVTEDLIERCRKEGIAKVAKALDLDYTTLYKRLKNKGITTKDLKTLKPPVTEEEVPVEEPTE